MTSNAIYDSLLGPITLTSIGEVLTALKFNPIDTIVTIDTKATKKIFQDTFRWLDIFFSGRQPDFTPQISLQGTDFQLRVWHALMEIPYGQTTTYGDLARRLSCRSAQAVGGAVGRNPIAVIVPCHRVIGSDGSLTGYAYGVEYKQYLLQIEKQICCK